MRKFLLEFGDTDGIVRKQTKPEPKEAERTASVKEEDVEKGALTDALEYKYHKWKAYYRRLTRLLSRCLMPMLLAKIVAYAVIFFVFL